MSPVTHCLTGWVLANAADLSSRDRAIVTFAAVIPDVDGLGVFAEIVTRNSQHPLLWFSEYDHALHTLLFAGCVSACAFVMSQRRWITTSLAFVAFHLHLLEDLAGYRGPDGFNWPIPYLFPFTCSRLYGRS